MRILGIDPGSRHTGWGLIEPQSQGLKAIGHGRISCGQGQPVAQRLAYLTGELENLIESWQPRAAVLETPFHGLNTRSLIVLAEARGALLAVLARKRVEIREYSPAEVKSAVTGNGRAGKLQVARMVRLLLALSDEGASSDATDALALAICFAHRERMDRLAEGKAAS